MNQSQIQHLRQLYEEATQGEWYEEMLGLVYTKIGNREVSVAQCETTQDAELICAMHKHLPELLDEIDLKQAEIELLKCQQQQRESHIERTIKAFELMSGITDEPHYLTSKEKRLYNAKGLEALIMSWLDEVDSIDDERSKEHDFVLRTRGEMQSAIQKAYEELECLVASGDPIGEAHIRCKMTERRVNIALQAMEILKPFTQQEDEN